MTIARFFNKYYNEDLQLDGRDIKTEKETKAAGKMGVWVVSYGYQYETGGGHELILDSKQALEFARRERMLDKIEYKVIL